MYVCALRQIHIPSFTSHAIPISADSSHLKRMLYRIAFLLITLISPAWIGWCDSPAVTVNPPVIRDAYVYTRGAFSRKVRLTDTLTVVVCKSEYDAWMRSQHPTPAIALYLEGVLMKGAVMTQLEQKLGSPPDPQSEQIQKGCAVSDPGVATAQADQVRADAVLAAASAAATAEQDPTKKTQLQKAEADARGTSESAK